MNKLTVAGLDNDFARLGNDRSTERRFITAPVIVAHRL